jgi:hypothetical protein
MAPEADEGPNLPQRRRHTSEVGSKNKTKGKTMFNLITFAKDEAGKFIALFHKDAPAAATALTEIGVAATDLSALAAASGSSSAAITALGKVAGIAGVGAQFLESEATASTVNQVGAGLTQALSEAQATGVVGEAAQAGLNALGSKVTAVSGVLSGIVAGAVVQGAA